MSRLLLILFVLFSLHVYAIEEDSNVRKNAVSIVVKQDFKSDGCDDKPKLEKTIYSFDSKDKIKNSEFYYNTVISDVTYENGIFKYKDIISKLHIETSIGGRVSESSQSFDFDLKLGQSYKDCSGSKYHDDRNFWETVSFGSTHHDTYSLKTTVLCDLPIPITIDNKEIISHLNIDKRESVKLVLGNFYQKGETRIRYQINGTNTWNECHKHVKIAPNATIELKYQDIVETADYNLGIGKLITIRVEKKLEGSCFWTYSEDIKCRFYTNGPDFDVLEVRRSSCDTEPIKIKIYTEDSGTFDNLIKNEECNWELTLAKNKEDLNSDSTYTFNLTECNQVIGEQYIYEILGENVKNPNQKLNDFLNEEIYASYVYGQLELNYIGEKSESKELQKYISNKKQFTIPQKIDKVKAEQALSEEINKNATDPKISLNIADGYNRFPYYFYPVASSNSTISETDDPIWSINEYKQGIDSNIGWKDLFNKNNTELSFAITKEDYKKDFFGKWYNAQSEEIKSTIIVDKNGYEKTEYDGSWEKTDKFLINNYDNVYYVYPMISRNGSYSGNTLLKFSGDIGKLSQNLSNYYKINDDEHYQLSVEKNNSYINISLQQVTRQYNAAYNSYSGDNITSSNINVFSYLLKLIGKGNGFYLAEMLEGGIGSCQLLKDNLEIISSSLSNLSYVSSKYDDCYIVNKNFIVFMKNKVFADVWHDGEYLTTYVSGSKSNINPYSFEVTDSCYYYLMGDKKYFRRFSPYSEKELYNLKEKNYDIELIGYDESAFNTEWNEFLTKRAAAWEAFLDSLKKDSYQVGNIPLADKLPASNLEQGEKAYSGYLILKDGDGCLSEPFKYTYKYYDLSFNQEVIKYPSTMTSKDGKVKLSIKNGSLAPYKYNNNGKYDTINGPITIGGLGYGDTSIELIDNKDNAFSRTITIPIPFTCTITQPKCSGGNGIITIKKSEEFVASLNKIIVYNEQNNVYKESKYNSSISFPLKIEIKDVGNYTIEAEYGSTEKIKLYRKNDNNEDTDIFPISFDKVFTISVDKSSIKDASEIGGNGSVEIKVCNAINSITWQNGGEYFNNLEFKNNKVSVELPARTYANITAEHDGCQSTLESFTIKAPSLIGNKNAGNSSSSNPGGGEGYTMNPNFVVTYNENNKTATIQGELSGENMYSLSLSLLNTKSYSNENIVADINGNKIVANTLNNDKIVKLDKSFKYDSSKKYYLYASYKAKETSQTYNLCLTPEGFVPLTLSDCSAKSSESNSSRCYGASAKINLSGDCDFMVNGAEIANNQEFVDTDEEDNTIVMSKQQSQEYDFFSMLQKVNRTDKLTIKKIEEPNIMLTSTNVSCKGGSNGTISVLSANNTKTSLDDITLSVPNHQASNKVEDLSACSNYKVTINDGGCIYQQTISVDEPSVPLSAKINSHNDPTCTNDNGEITIEPSGGWGDYVMTIDNTGKFPTSMEDLNNDETHISSTSTSDKRTHTFTGLGNGSHTIYVYDNYGCYMSVSQKLEEYTNPSFTLSADTISCYGEKGTIDIKDIKYNGESNGKLNGEVIDFNRMTYECKELSICDTIKTQNSQITNIASGLYTITLYDSKNCSTAETIEVIQPEPLELEAIPLNNAKIQYKGGNDGQIRLMVNGGNTGYKYVTIGDVAESVAILTSSEYIYKGIPAGTHKIKATDSKECLSKEIEVNYIEPEKALSVNIETTDALCHAETGSATINVDGGWGNYKIELVGKDVARNVNTNSKKFESLYAGNYKLTVTDDRGAVFNDEVIVNAPGPIISNKIVNNATCENNGSIELVIDGGVKDYTSTWGTDSIKGNNPKFTGLDVANGYSILTVDGNGCVKETTFDIEDNKLGVSFDYIYADNVTVVAKVSGGIPQYNYTWYLERDNKNPLSRANSLATDKAGIYRFVVSDAQENCSKEEFVAVLTEGSKYLDIVELQRQTKFGVPNGYVILHSDETSFEYLTLFSMVDGSKDIIDLLDSNGNIRIDNLDAGEYSVEGKLKDGTYRLTTFEILRYEKVKVTKTEVRPVLCPTSNDGYFAVSFSGGIAPYKVSIDEANTTDVDDGFAKFADLSPNTYQLTILDAANNEYNFDSFTIAKPSELKLSYEGTPMASCYDASNAEVTLVATGGWGGYEYSKIDNKNYDTSKEFGSLHAGDIKFYVIDRYGVETTTTVPVGEPAELHASIDNNIDVRCNGESNGQISFVVTGGTPDYKTIFLNNDIKQTREGVAFNDLSSREYSVTFIDANQCTSPDVLTFDIKQPNILKLLNTETVQSTCELDNGKLVFEATGGTKPYTFSWKESGKAFDLFEKVGDSLTQAENLNQNQIYNAFVVDDKGCKAEAESIKIEKSSNPRINNVSTIDVRCFGSADGVAVVNVNDITESVPSSPYHISWPFDQKDVMSVSNLPAGDHVVTITDENNCSSTYDFHVGTPAKVQNKLVASKDAHCFGYDDGQLVTKTIGGVLANGQDYKYKWSTDEETSTIDNLKAGTYTVVVMDDHNCSDTASYAITEPDAVKVNLGDDVIICPESSYTFDPGVYSKYYWYTTGSDEVIETNRYLTVNTAGTYHILVKDDIECMARDTVYLGIGDDALQASFLISSNASLKDTIVAIEMSNLPLDKIEWKYDTEVFEDISPEGIEDYMTYFSAGKIGTHYITMNAYAGGCLASDTKQIDIYDLVEDYDEFKIGYDPLIKSVKVAPNPNNGEFFVMITLREEAKVTLTINSVNTAQLIENRTLEGGEKYVEQINIKSFGSGIYVLSVTAEDEKRVLKILSVK